MKFRTLNRMFAAAAGYFWLECPCCGKGFGGHEWKDRDRNGYLSSIPCYSCDDPGHCIAICPDCTNKGIGYDKFQWGGK